MEATYTFPDHLKGDTFNGVSFTVKVNGVALPLTDALVRMDLRNKYKALKKRLSSDVAIGGISITDAANGIFQIDKQIIDVPAGVYNYDIEFTLADGTVYTYIGGTWTILQDVTHD